MGKPHEVVRLRRTRNCHRRVRALPGRGRVVVEIGSRRRVERGRLKGMEMQAKLINLGLRLFGMQGKLAGHNTKVALAINALLITSSAMLALVNALMIAQTGDYGTAITTFIYSEEFRIAVGLWTGGKFVAANAHKQDKNTAAMVAYEQGNTETAERIAKGLLSPQVVLEPGKKQP